MKTDVIPYSSAVTFGRFNIPHSGHVELVKLMLDYAECAHVVVSDGRANNDWDLRTLLFKHLCREAGVDLSRVNFWKASSPFDSVSNAVEVSKWKETVIVLGSDQEAMARTLGEVYDCPHILNRRTNSSTQMRFFLDAEDFREDLLHLYNGDEYATTLAMILRKEELRREKSEETAR